MADRLKEIIIHFVNLFEMGCCLHFSDRLHKSFPNNDANVSTRIPVIEKKIFNINDAGTKSILNGIEISIKIIPF